MRLCVSEQLYITSAVYSDRNHPIRVFFGVDNFLGLISSGGSGEAKSDQSRTDSTLKQPSRCP
jgi:hypothetical protein